MKPKTREDTARRAARLADRAYLDAVAAFDAARFARTAERKMSRVKRRKNRRRARR